MNATHALGWALVHFVWQGAALALLLGIALAITRSTAARTRYALAIVTLAAMLVLPIATTLRLYDRLALDAVIARVARTPGDVDVRRKALETYVEAASSDSALGLLQSILASNAPDDISSKALETLEAMDEGAGIPLLIETARSHPNRDVRADALRRLAESDDPRAQKVFDQTLRRP